MLTVVIVEDNIEDAELLKVPLLEMQPDAEILIFQSGNKACDFLKDNTNTIDIFFLDRELPDITGFEVAERIRSMDRYSVTPIVFVTGYEMDKLYAYEHYCCYHYLLKPFNKKIVKGKISNLLKVLNENKPAPLNKVIHLLTKEGEVLILIDDIFFIEKNVRGCLVYTSQKIYDTPRMNLEKIIDEINQKYFVRCHKSFAVNLKKVNSFIISRRDIWAADFKNKIEGECLISKSYYKNVTELYRDYLETLKVVDNNDLLHN